MLIHKETMSDFVLYVPLGDDVEQIKITGVKDKIGNKAFHQDACVPVCVYVDGQVCGPSPCSVEDIY